MGRRGLLPHCSDEGAEWWHLFWESSELLPLEGEEPWGDPEGAEGIIEVYDEMEIDRRG